MPHPFREMIPSSGKGLVLGMTLRFISTNRSRSLIILKGGGLPHNSIVSLRNPNHVK
jgi:hypothetical protein